MSVVFSRRPFGYKMGLFMLYFGIVFFIMGFASPYWYKMSAGLVYIHGGLWQSCVQMLLLRVCSNTPRGSSASSWLVVVQGLQCAGLVGLITSGLYGIVVNWVQRKPSHTRLLELLGVLSSALTFVGCVVFVVQTQNGSEELKKLTTTVQFRRGAIGHTVYWALGLDLGASIICLLASCLIAINNSDIPQDHTPDVLGYTDPHTGACVYPVIDTANQEVYYIPPQTTAGGFQPIASGFQPPAYETAVAAASAPPYSCPPYSQYAAK